MGTDQSPDPMYTALMGQRDTAVALATSRLLDLEECRRQLAEAIKDRDNSLKIANANHAQWERAEAERDAAVAAERGRCLRIAEFYERHNGDDDAWEMCAQYIARDISGGQEPLTGVEAADRARAALASNSGGG